MRRRTNLYGPPSQRSILLAAAAGLGLLCAVLAVFYLVGTRLEEAAVPKETYGDLSTRFTPTSTLTHGGQTYAHYENYYTNILLIGVDETSLSDTGVYRSGGQADFLLLLAIDRHRRTITPIHIDRDTVTPVQIYGPFGDPAGTRPMQLCLAHAFGSSQQQSSENTAQAVSSLLGGIRIDQYLTLDMDGISLLNDALGGVTVTLEDDFSHLDPAMTRGRTLTLQGRQAEYYVRGRHGVGDNTNRERMTRQRAFIEAAVALIEAHAASDAAFIGTLFDTLTPHMCTSIQRSWLMNHTYMLTQYARADVQSLPGTHSIGADGFMEFHPDSEGLTALMVDIFYQ